MSTNFLRRIIVQGPTTITGGRDNELNVVFKIQQWHSGSPGMANVQVYNPSPATQAAWKDKEGTKVTISAGYESNCGVVFSGDLKQVVYAHEENTVNSYLSIFLGDGDQQYRKAVVTKTLAKGWTPQDKVNAALEAMKPFGVTMGVNNLDLSRPVYPRGTPLIGMARSLLREVTLSAGGLWSVQMGKLMLTPKSLDTGNSETITLTAQTGLVGWPQQTQDGIVFRSLINPALQPLCKVTLDPSQIIEAERNNNSFDTSAFDRNVNLDKQNLAAGKYTVYRVERSGSTRGGEWFDDCTAIGQGGVLPSGSDLSYSIGSQ